MSFNLPVFDLDIVHPGRYITGAKLTFRDCLLNTPLFGVLIGLLVYITQYTSIILIIQLFILIMMLYSKYYII